MIIPEGPICVLGLDSKYKADFIIEAKAGSQNLLMWPEVHDGVPVHPYHLKGFIDNLIEQGDNIVIVTQSITVIRCFNKLPENVFVCSGIETRQITEKFDETWLRDFEVDLGELYESGCMEDQQILDLRVKRMEWF